MPKPPPRKRPFTDRRDRQFLYLYEVEAIIAATRQTRAPIRNQAIAMLLFCQALQPSEICWLRWCDLNFTANTLLVVRNRSKSLRIQPQIAVNQQLLCPAEMEILQELAQLGKTDWILESERQQRLSDRSLHHIVYQAGTKAKLPIPQSTPICCAALGYITVLLYCCKLPTYQLVYELIKRRCKTPDPSTVARFYRRLYEY